jgi:putative CocE/NonD family hydrolase
MRTFLIVLPLALLSCGASVPRAEAETRRPSGTVQAPLIEEDLVDSSAVARALRAHYTKHEFRIPMRDGARLFTAVYVPKDTSRTYPILMHRTPYGAMPYGVDNFPTADDSWGLAKLSPAQELLRDGMIVVVQDVRGRMMSEGTFVDVRPIAAGQSSAKGAVDESTDAWDTIDWLVKNVASNNGRVGIWGISYPGFYAAQAAVNAHPALKAVSPQAPVTDWFLGDDFHHNGAFLLADAFGFFASFGKPRPKPTPKMVWGFDYDTGDIYEFFLRLGPLANANEKHLEGKIAFWNDMMTHGTRDAYWKARDPRPHYRNARPAILTVGGWFDAEDLWGALETYRSFENQSPSAKNHLVMGPWVHGGWQRTDGDRVGNATFGAKTTETYKKEVLVPFFRHYLEQREEPHLAEATIFETGTNTWNRFPSWPPKNAKMTDLYLRGDHALSAAAPTNEAGAADSYVSDPDRPVPVFAQARAKLDHDYMTDDQRFAAHRPDVLMYTTPILEADLTLAGPIQASLWVTTTGTDGDFVVKLIDVYPETLPDPTPNPGGVRLGGYQQLVRGEVMRGKFRTSFEQPTPFRPGEPTLVRFDLPDVCHTFRPGHRLAIQIQSSWFPLVDRNPQTFVDIYTAKAADFQTATHRVLRGGAHASSIKVPVLRGSLPQ